MRLFCYRDLCCENRPFGRVLAAKITVANGPERRGGVKAREAKRSDARSALGLDAEHGSGSATSMIGRRNLNAQSKSLTIA
jgi:hypothetical protein